MKGYPKHLNSRADYDYVLANFTPAEYAPSFQALLDTAYEWFPTGTLETKEDGVEDDTHRIITATEEEVTTYTQQEYMVNENAKLFRLGYTIDEVRAIISAVNA